MAEQVLKATLLRPASPEILRQLDEMAELVEKAVNDEGGWVVRDPLLAASCCFSLGLKAFREGDYARAEVWLHRSNSYPGDTESRVASSRLLLAMMDSGEGGRKMPGWASRWRGKPWVKP